MKQRADGRWCKKIKLPDGSTKYFYSTATTEKKAIKDISQQLLAYSEKQEESLSFCKIADLWDTEYRKTVTELNYRKNTKAAFNRIKDYFTHYNDISKITHADLSRFLYTLITKGYYKKTVSSHKSILNMIFRYAVINGYVSYNPMRDIILPSNLPKKQREFPKTEEIKIVNSHYKEFDLLPFFLLYTGCRKSEALAITYNDIDFENNLIKIRHHIIHDGNKPIYEPVLKTDAAYRDIILLERLKEILPKKFNGFLFSMNNDGKNPLTKCAYDKRWKKYCKKYNVNFTAHQLRHGYATMLFEAGIDLKDAQDLMGHSDINLTRQIYTHIRSERKQETANKLNSFNF